MNTVMQRLWVILMLGLILALSACDGGSSVASPIGPPPPSADPQIALQRVFPQISFNAPVAMMQAPGDSSRWFIVEQQGIVHVFDNDPNVSSSDVFVDISA